MILIGSRALKLRAPGLLTREPKDFDFVASDNEYLEWMFDNGKKLGKLISCSNSPSNKNFKYPQDQIKFYFQGEDATVEFEFIKPERSSWIFDKFVKEDSETIRTSFGMVPNLDLLFTIKSSHRYLKNSPHFWKTLQDYHRMKAAGAHVRPEYREFLKMREDETYTYKHPSLNQKKDTFFADDGIKYKFDHDSIHDAVCYLSKPAYKFYAKDGEEVKSDKAKFFSATPEIRLYGVIEEAATLALERSLIPHPGVMTPEQAWMFALSKVCTSITSGWFREWAYENIFDVIKLWSTDKTLYWRKFQEGVDNGTVKPYSKM